MEIGSAVLVNLFQYWTSSQSHHQLGLVVTGGSRSDTSTCMSIRRHCIRSPDRPSNSLQYCSSTQFKTCSKHVADCSNLVSSLGNLPIFDSTHTLMKKVFSLQMTPMSSDCGTGEMNFIYFWTYQMVMTYSQLRKRTICGVKATSIASLGVLQAEP